MEQSNLNKGVVLLVMDIQKRMMESISASGRLLENIANAIAAARLANIPVVYVRIGFRPGHPEISSHNMSFATIKQSGNLYVETDEGTAIHPAVMPEPHDIIIIKKRISGFAGSDLDLVLRTLQASQLVLTGFATSGVVLSTVREAADKDYRQIVLSDGCADRDEEIHQFLLSKILSKQAAILTTSEWINSLM